MTTNNSAYIWDKLLIYNNIAVEVIEEYINQISEFDSNPQKIAHWDNLKHVTLGWSNLKKYFSTALPFISDSHWWRYRGVEC